MNTPLDFIKDISELALRGQAHLTNTNPNIIAQALQILFNYLMEDEHDIDSIDTHLIDYFIQLIDERMANQLDAILHHPQFQALESSWRGLDYMLQQLEAGKNCKIEIMNLSKQQLIDDFDYAEDIQSSKLYKKLYCDEYDMPGGEPIGAVISDYQIDNTPQDMQLLRSVSAITCLAHCPFIAAVSEKFFLKENYQQLSEIRDLIEYMQRNEYISWNQFRNSEQARYVGLSLPKFLLRLPYGTNNPSSHFHYHENVIADHDQYYLWGSASFALAANIINSFQRYGWSVNIRGPESGGRVDNLPLHQFNSCSGLQTKIPTQCLIPESREVLLAQLGFIPLSYYKNKDYGCFFSANSVQSINTHVNNDIMANKQINARLPYIFLVSRIAHYLKVLQREKIGSSQTCQSLQQQLNTWLQTLVTKMNHPDSQLAARYPLREAQVSVSPQDNNPGHYHVNLSVLPHFQIEGVDMHLSLVAQMPGK